MATKKEWKRRYQQEALCADRARVSYLNEYQAHADTVDKYADAVAERDDLREELGYEQLANEKLRKDLENALITTEHDAQYVYERDCDVQRLERENEELYAELTELADGQTALRKEIARLMNKLCDNDEELTGRADAAKEFEEHAWKRVAELSNENEALRAELTELADQVKYYSDVLDLGERHEDALRAELTELADDLQNMDDNLALWVETWKTAANSVLRLQGDLEDANRDMDSALELFRAYATEAYDAGRAEGERKGFRQGQNEGRRYAADHARSEVQAALERMKRL